MVDWQQQIKGPEQLKTVYSQDEILQTPSKSSLTELTHLTILVVGWRNALNKMIWIPA